MGNIRRKGFTIVELLIVIVVIAILAAISVVAYNGIQERAKATALADGFQKVYKAFHLYATADGLSSWPTYGGNPTIDTMISTTNAGNYLQSTPTVPGITASQWIYDNDNDEYGSSCTTSTPGVNIFIQGGVDPSLAQRVDNAIDDGLNNCGKVRWATSGANFRIIISEKQAVNP